MSLTQEQELRLRAIYRSGVYAQATLVLGQLVISPTQKPRRVLVRVPYGRGDGVGGVLLADLHCQSLAEAAQEIFEELADGTTLPEAARWARWVVRELLEEHPAPSPRHLLETYAGLCRRAHADFQPVLLEGLRNALRALGVSEVEAIIQAAR